MSGMQYETDVAIIGAGGAGIAAGIEARDAGASVIAFEKGTEPGGAARISGGGCLIVGSTLQRKKGIEDNPDLAFKDWMDWGGPSADMVWARYYIEHSQHDLHDWAEGLGAKWAEVQIQEGNSVSRWTRAEGAGLGLMDALIDGYRKKGGELVAGTEITKLTIEDGRVTGVEMYNGAPYLVIGDSILPLSTVISLNEIAAQANNDDTENPNVPTEEAAA